MASTTDTTTNCDNEIHLKAIKDQILSNLRILKPDVKDPIITSAYMKKKSVSEDSGKPEGLWTASVWDHENKILFSTYGVDADLVTAMRTLLRLTSAVLDPKLDEWHKTSPSSIYTGDGIKYD